MKTFISTNRASHHGIRAAAQAQADRRNRHSGPGVTYTVEHTGSREFSVMATVTVTSSPAPVVSIMGGAPIVCQCGSADWYYTGASSIFCVDYECAACQHKIFPMSETAASQ